MRLILVLTFLFFCLLLALFSVRTTRLKFTWKAIALASVPWLLTIGILWWMLAPSNLVCSDCDVIAKPWNPGKASPEGALKPKIEEDPSGPGPVDKKGIYSFRRHTIIAVYPLSKADQALEPLVHSPQTSVQSKIEYPEIISPKNNETDAWNRIHREHAPPTDDCEEDESYSVDYVANNFISLATIGSVYCPGTPHPTTSFSRDNRLLSLHRQIVAADIFNLGKPWETALTSFVRHELEVDDQGDLKRSLKYSGAGCFRKAVIDPANWGFDKEGMTIDVTNCLLGNAGPDIIIPWERLKPYLKTHPAFALPFENHRHSQ